MAFGLPLVARSDVVDQHIRTTLLLVLALPFLFLPLRALSLPLPTFLSTLTTTSATFGLVNLHLQVD